MNSSTIIFTLSSFLLTLMPAQSNEFFMGDVKLACEAILCLSAGSPPSECTPSLQRYYSIQMKTFSETVKARKKFLSLCPVASQKIHEIELIETQ